MKKIIVLAILALALMGLSASISDIQLDIGELNTICGYEVTVPIVCSSLTGNGVISYELEISYDTARLDFIEPVKTSTLSANGMVSVNEVNGVLHIGAIFTNALYGQGTLLGLKFTAIFPGTADLLFDSAVMNTTSLTQLSGGAGYH